MRIVVFTRFHGRCDGITAHRVTFTINRFVQNNRAEQVVIIHTQLACADDSALAVLC
jgi:anti-anti-sigma regulatory factor